MLTSRTIVLAATLASVATAQQVTYENHNPRAASTLFFFDGETPLGIVALQYGAPDWKDEYRAMVASDRSGAFRLGKDAWASLDVGLPLAFGDRLVPADQYYLGLERDADGKFALLLLDADAVRKERVLPTDPGAIEAAAKLPLAFSETDALQKSLQVRLTKSDDDPQAGALTLHWGPYVLRTNWTVPKGPTRQVAFDAMLTDMIALIDAKEHEQLIRKYANPEFLRDKMEELPEIAAGFAGEKADRLRKILMQVKQKDVTVAADQDQVEVPVEGGPQDEIRFRYIDGRWRLLDK